MKLQKKSFIRNKNITLPNTLDEAIDIIMDVAQESVEGLKMMSEDDFISSTHHGFGTFMRNTWCLWWFPDHPYKGWPEEEPSLNKWFRSIGIVHADDMSGIILTCVYRKLHGLPYELDKEVEHYHNHWKEQGSEDGIPKH